MTAASNSGWVPSFAGDEMELISGSVQREGAPWGQQLEGWGWRREEERGVTSDSSRPLPSGYGGVRAQRSAGLGSAAWLGSQR